MSTWDKVSLRFIALVVAFIVLGYGIKFIADVKQQSDAMTLEHIKQQNDEILKK